MQVVRQLDEGLWREFVESHPQSQIFHTPEMFEVFSRTKGCRPTFWAAVDDDNRPLALLLPVEITLMNGPLRRFTSRAVGYGSVLCAPGPQGEIALEQLLLVYQQTVGKNLLFTELRNLSDLEALQPILNKCGFAYEEHLNFMLDLDKPQKEIWESIRSNARRNIHKARKSQVVIEEINDPQRIPGIYALLRGVYRRIQVPLADISLFQSAFALLHRKGMMEILVAKVGDADIGVLTLLLHKDIVTYWYTGTLREYSSYRSGDLLVWHALEWGNQHGFRVLDFGGAGKPDEEYGVREFKAKFGGALVSYGRNVCLHAPLIFRASKTAYQLARRFM